MGIHMPVVCIQRWTAEDTGCPGGDRPSPAIGRPATASASQGPSRNSAVEGLPAQSSGQAPGARP